MKILLLTSEEWNDKKYGNNNMTNWFTNFPDLEISHVYCSSGKPYNDLCNNYFQVTDKQMAKSLLPKGKRAGSSFKWHRFDFHIFNGDSWSIKLSIFIIFIFYVCFNWYNINI